MFKLELEDYDAATLHAVLTQVLKMEMPKKSKKILTRIENKLDGHFKDMSDDKILNLIKVKPNGK